jgi:hypothetical protein
MGKLDENTSGKNSEGLGLSLEQLVPPLLIQLMAPNSWENLFRYERPLVLKKRMVQ